MGTYQIETEDGIFEVEVEDEPQKTFTQGLTEGGAWDFTKKAVTAPFRAIGDAYTGVKQEIQEDPSLLGSGPFALPAALGRAMYRGVETPTDALARTGEIVGGAFPGGRTGFDYVAGKAGLMPEKTPYEYGQSLREDLEFAPAQVLIPAATRFSKVRGANSAARVAAKEAALSDPASQAAIRYSQNRGLLNTESAKKALARGEITPEIQDAARIAQKEAVLTQQAPEGRDYLPGTAMGMPESSASTRPFAASEEMAKAAPALIESGAYNGGQRINPFTGKFEGPPSTPVNEIALAAKLETASADIISARKQVVGTLDEAMQTLNQTSPGEPKVRGIMFDADISPAVGSLKDVISKRSMLAQTVPMSQEMQGAYNKIRESFNNIQNSSLLNRWNKIGPTGAFESGELLPSQALSLIEDMNAFRRAVGEFDEAGRAQGLNSTFSDYTGRQAELYAISNIQDALQGALEAKAKEIVQLAPGVKGYYSWQDKLPLIKEDTLASMNRNYSAFQTAQEAARTYRNTTHRGMVNPEPGRLVTTVQNQDVGAQAADVVSSPGRAAIRGAVNKVLGQQPQNRPLEAATRNLQRPTLAISQVVDGLLLRDKPVPILSRSWERVKADPNALAELGKRAEILGFVGPGLFQILSDPAKMELHKNVIQAYPQGAEQYPGGLDIINGEYTNPLEKDSIVRQSLNLPPEERAIRIGESFQNKYVPMAAPTPMPQPKPKALPVVLDRLNRSMAEPEPYRPRDFDSSYDGSNVAMLEQLTKSEALHRGDYE